MKKNVLLIGLLLFCVTIRGQLIINELMQSNIDCIMDDLNEFPDSWVELYNTSDQEVSLSDYKLGDSKKPKKAYSLPEQTIPANGYVVIYCDKEGKGLHTDFRLESGKDGCVYLFQNGIAVDSLTEIPKQPAPNISYGRCYGKDKINFFRTPTPAAQNESKVYKKDAILPDPVFSQPGQVFTSETTFTISLSMPEGTPENTSICYTLDGSEPTADNGTISDEEVSITIDKTTLVRAKLVNVDYLSPRALTQSYLFLGHETDMPIVSLTTNDAYWNDDKIGILIEGTYSEDTANYKYDWRRPVNMEFFNTVGEPSQLNQLCETRVHGNTARIRELKSLVLYANKRFGEKRFEQEFFPDQRPGITDFKSIILHNASGDFSFLYMRDALVQRSMAQYQDLDWMAWRPIIIFINGTYKGVLAIRERSNEDNIYSNYDGLEDITMVENWYELKTGEESQRIDFFNFVHTQGHTWEELNQMYDCTEFINHTIMELFYSNVDYPGNNVAFWRPIADASRWRMIAKDCDNTLGLYDMPADYDMFEFMYNPNYDPNHAWANPERHTTYFRYAMEDSTYREEFINRAVVYLGDFMRYDRIKALMENMRNSLFPELYYHLLIYNIYGINYDVEFDNVLSWLSQRHAYFLQHMANRYNLNDAVELTIDSVGLAGHTLSLNGITLSEPYWQGGFYGGRDIKLSAQTSGENAIKGWKVTYLANSDYSMDYYSGSELNLTMPLYDDFQQVLIQAITDDKPTGTPSLDEDHLHITKCIYNLQGIPSTTLQKGVNIIVYRDGTVEKIMH